MPIYEYRCDNCGVFEFSQRITEDPLKKCPTCKGKVRRLISNTSFMLKGSGWYATDYGRSGRTSGSESTTANGKSGESAGSASSASSTDKTSTDKSSTNKSSSGDKAASSS